ncbi:hypothetical protein ABK046_48035, partial [Streptomyces caeruleatus]
NTEMKQLIEDAAKLLDIALEWINGLPYRKTGHGTLRDFNPCNPERGDLMKVAEAAELDIDFDAEAVFLPTRFPHSQEGFEFLRSNY